MSHNKYNIEEVAEVFENEGLGYGITHYFDVRAIEDPQLRKMCIKASELLKEIQKYVTERVDWYG